MIRTKNRKRAHGYTRSKRKRDEVPSWVVRRQRLAERLLSQRPVEEQSIAAQASRARLALSRRGRR